MRKVVHRKKKSGKGLFSPLLSGLFGGKKTATRKRVVRRRGGNIFDVLKTVANGLGGTVNAGVSGLFGGKNRKRVVRRRGGEDTGILTVPDPIPKPRRGVFGKVNDLLKDSQIISKALDTFGSNNSIASGIGTAAATLGYGRKKIVRRRKIGGAYANLNA